MRQDVHGTREWPHGVAESAPSVKIPIGQHQAKGIWISSRLRTMSLNFSPYSDILKVYRHILLLTSDQKSSHSRLHFSRNKDLSSSITQEPASTDAPPAKPQYKTLKEKTAPPEKTMAPVLWTRNDMQLLLQGRAGVMPGHAGVMIYKDIRPLLSTVRSDTACRIKIFNCLHKEPCVYPRFKDIVDFYLPSLLELERLRKLAKISGKSQAKQDAQASTQSQGPIAGAVNAAQPEDSEEEPGDSEEEPEYSEEKPESSQSAQQHEEEAKNEEDEVEDVEIEGASLPSYLTILEECLKECHFIEKNPPASGVIPGLGPFLKAKLEGRDVAFFHAVEAHCRRLHAVEKTRKLTAREKMRLWELRQAAGELKYSH
ncbi:hypothetical protein CBER1_11178 [Cercospora berteroae]|uniref:Uncharacterized protein n=1 Tax=Cercospora berteroae TaxID=357750 RepID=A0A2S6CAG9_9PEZI|nr:hypothetical protein CBER1_11178 [Cercospora berteroae]